MVNARANEFELERILERVLEECMSNEFAQGLLDETMAEVQPQKRSYIARDWEATHERLMSDYFNTNLVYKDVHFRRRFRMLKVVLLRILHALEDHDAYFKQRIDALGRPSLSPHQKYNAAIKLLCYGIAADGLDEYLKIGESTTLECVIKFCKGVITIFVSTYHRKPTLADMNYILAINEARGFSGMLGSLDCMHWEWKNYLSILRGSHSRRDHGNRPTVVLEAVVTRDLWIWHSFFDMAGSNDDLTMLNHSRLFENVINCWQPPV